MALFFIFVASRSSLLLYLNISNAVESNFISTRFFFYYLFFQQALDKAGAIATLVSLLGLKWKETPGLMDGDGVGKGGGGGSARGGAEDLENQVLQCMFYLCRISRKRQEKAAVAGLIPHLRRRVLC